MNSNGDHPGEAQEALESLERVAHLDLEVGAAHPALDGAVLEALESLERAARLEAGAVPPALDGAALESLERAEDLPHHGAPQVVHGALEKVERVVEDPERVAREDPARVARGLNVTLLLVGTAPPALDGAAQESLERAEDRPRIGALQALDGAPLEALESPERAVVVL